MYQRQLAKLPQSISRDAFIDEIFELGQLYEYGYDTILGAIELADRFMLITTVRPSYHTYTLTSKQFLAAQECYKEIPDALTKPIDQYYSKELAVVTLTLAGKSNEDDCRNIKYGIKFCENYYMVKMEWEIAYCFNYYVKVDNFITTIGLVFGLTIGTNINLDTIFKEIARDICRLDKWWTISHATIMLAIMYLYQHRKLRAMNTDKLNKFKTFITTIASETELPISTILDTYINLHK